LNVTKTARNLSNGGGFSNSINANPSDIIMFMITVQNNGNQSAQNVFIRDSLPANLIYNNQLVVSCSGGSYNNNCNGNYYNYSGNITSGINLNTVYTGQTVTITYQAQVAPASSFTYGATTINNNASVTSSNYTGNSSAASIMITKATVLGASTISTGLTNNFWIDSFFLPLFITLVIIWMWKSGIFIGFETWLDGKRKTHRSYRAEKELYSRVAKIQKFGE
jgi:uncharacterized repeat protein (TIGR01451 family)